MNAVGADPLFPRIGSGEGGPRGEPGQREEEGSLHRTIRRLVLGRILSGVIPPGQPVGVSALARETGISRTPVRETLLQLHRDGFLTLEENRGFFVRPLTEREAQELYPILHALEDLALLSSGRPPARRLERLEALNARLASSTDPMEAIGLNVAWHRALVDGCGNRELTTLVDRYRMRVFRYEHAYYAPGDERVGYSPARRSSTLCARATSSPPGRRCGATGSETFRSISREQVRRRPEARLRVPRLHPGRGELRPAKHHPPLMADRRRE